ncbi:MAG: ATP-binding protein [Acidobacteriota bacterium]
MAKIKVHEKALAHLSRGLYRSPASALRELVSNAWDANAHTVRIDTNYPHFLQLAVRDDGDGFTKKAFRDLMEGGIGYSEKRPAQLALINDRPVIGRLGIGMLGIAQICGAFTITSTPSKGAPFTARVRLYDLLKERLDQDDAQLVSETEVGREVDVGEYDFVDHKPSARHGTSIIADDVHPTFARSFQKSLTFEKFKEPSLDWAKSVKTTQSIHSLQELGDYWRLLWELAASCPIPYLSDRALPERVIAEDHKRLLSYDFKLVVDNITLAKPINLQRNPGGYTVRRIDPEHRLIYGRDLRFHGYIVVQEGAQLKPDELRGVLIRIKNVAIGYYDPSMLDYRYNEGPRSRWLTGEIFVDEGLEDALNIDRDSFNRFHPQFRALQETVHKVLQEDVFPGVYRNIKVRSTKKEEERKEKRSSALSAVLTDAVGKPVRIREAEEGEEVGVDEHARSLDVTIPAAENIKTRKTNRDLAGAIMAVFEVALRERGKEAQRERFMKLLLELLAEW